jgi:hypothetical protein
MWLKTRSLSVREILGWLQRQNILFSSILRPGRLPGAPKLPFSGHYYGTVISCSLLNQIPTFMYLNTLYVPWSISVAATFKACVCCLYLALIEVSNSAGAWMSVSCDCCVLSDGRLCIGLITLPETSYRMWCVSVIVNPWKWGGPDHTRGCPTIK